MAKKQKDEFDDSQKHQEEDVYDEPYLEELEESDEITPREEAFMEGYDKLEEKLAKKPENGKQKKPHKIVQKKDIRKKY